MLRRNVGTIILIGRDRIARADLALGHAPEVVTLVQRVRPETNDLAALVEAAVTLGGKKPRRVVVLSSELWTQTLHMQAEMTQGLADHELGRALAFEAEPLSGMTAFDSQLAFVPLAGQSREREFWLVQLPLADVERVEQVVHKAGGSVVGLAHPAGLWRQPHRAPGDAWQRVELWPGAIVCLDDSVDRPLQARIINAEPSQRTWHAGLEQWRKAVGDSDRLAWLVPEAGIAAPAIGQANDPVFNLADEASLRAWLAMAAEQLFGKSPSVPLVRPAPRPISKERRRAIAGALGLLVAAGCWGHSTFTQRQIADLNAQAGEFRDQATRFNALKKQITDQATKRDKTQTQVEALRSKVGDCTDTLAAHRLRWRRLLQLLAEHRPEHLVIQKIDSSSRQLKISGLCLGPHPANEMTSDLGFRLKELGWQIEPAQQEAGKALVGGDPWTFEMVLIDAQPTPQAVAGAPAPIPGRPLRPQPPVNKVVSFREGQGAGQP